MGRYEAYPEYKDSGLGWLGDVPVHWNVLDLKRHVWVKTGYAFASESFVDDGEPIIRIGDIQQDGSVSLDGCKFIPLDQAKQHSNYLVYSGELLMAMTGATIGKAGWYKYKVPALVNQRVGVFKTNLDKLNYRFLWFVLKSSGYQEYIKLTAFGGAQPNISDVGMVGYKTVLPTLQEQEKIANFLDHETAKIDTLIERQQQLIQLLKEKRQAVISHAVTKGLNPNARMKDSGVEWLGEVPDTWSTSYLGFECSVKARLGWKGLKAEEYVDEGFIFLATPNIKGEGIDFENVNYITKQRYDESPEIKLEVGDVLVTKDGSTTGTTNVVRFLPSPATVNSSIAVLRSAGRVSSLYLYYFFVSTFTQNVIKRMQGGMGVPHLFQADLRKFFLLVPPKSQQDEITAYIESKLPKFDLLISQAIGQIGLLTERRTALISAAVTGKIDVRNFSAQLT